MRVWITKYALTTGIFEMEVESQSEDGTGVYGNCLLYTSKDQMEQRIKDSSITKNVS